MKNRNSVGELACREYLLEGNKLTGLEASTLFGVSWLSKLISGLRKEGWVIKSQTCTYAAANERINKYATLVPPTNLPVREIYFTEYWVNK